MEHHTENSTEEEFTIASSWYEGEEDARLKAKEKEPSTGLKSQSVRTFSRYHKPGTEEDKVDTNPDLINKEDKPFINLDTIGLRRSTIIK